ncbi:MAG TPA: hypothetical protein ENK52_02685 [Saprospiraceae bacterium]|nr:hypothetical protein [Saprospiraceae bacterium]
MFKLRENIFFKNVSVLFLGTVISQAINIGGLPILSRMYGTAEFSTLAIFMAMGLIVLSFSTLKLDYAIVRSEMLEERLALIRAAFLSVLLVAIVVSVGLLGWSWWSTQLGFSFVSTLFIFFIANGGNQILIYFFNSEKKYKHIATARILSTAANLIFAIVLFYWSPQLGLIVALTLANVFSFISLFYFFRKKIKAVFAISNSRLLPTLRKNAAFIKFSTPASFLDILSYQVVIIFLAKYFSEEITGSFFMAMRIVLLPTALVGNAISQVFYKDISDKFFKNTLAAVDFWKIWKILIGLGIIPFALLTFYGKEIFGFVLGEEWMMAGEMAAILAITGFFIFVSSPTSTGFVVMNQQKYNLLNSSIRLMYTIVFLMWSAAKNDIFFFLWNYAIAEFLMIIAYNWVMIRLLNKRLT